MMDSRKLPTIISRETIKPSSPTPSHLNTYNLSEVVQLCHHTYMPLILFYPNTCDTNSTTHEKASVLKKSLSQSLTQYYPFAGRLQTPPTPVSIDCNDEGVVFLEAIHDSKMETFQDISVDDETMDQLFANGVVFYNSHGSKNLVAGQLNYFSCGGIGVAISMSHLIGDACTLSSFASHWASVACYGSIDHKHVLPFNLHFIHSSHTPGTDFIHHEAKVNKMKHLSNSFVLRKFVFPNSKLSDLKDKVSTALKEDGYVNINPTRVDVLTSLLYKTAMEATTTKSGTFKPSYLFFMVNVRNKCAPKLPQATIGNFVRVMMVPTRHMVVAEIMKTKLQLEGIQSVQELANDIKLMRSKYGNRNLENVASGSYYFTSLCSFPLNKLDFGWGKPMGTTILTRVTDRNGFVLVDTPNDDGIEAFVMLEKEQMEIFENDGEMLLFCQSN